MFVRSCEGRFRQHLEQQLGDFFIRKAHDKRARVDEAVVDRVGALCHHSPMG